MTASIRQIQWAVDGQSPVWVRGGDFENSA
jgi:hypothetical protein